MALFPGLSRWADTRKEKPIWILLKQETVSGSGICWAICKFAPCSSQITMPVPYHSSFLQAGCPSCRPTNSIKTLKTRIYIKLNRLVFLRAWQSSHTTSLQVLFGLPLRLGPSTSYSIHFFTQSSSSFRRTCPYQSSLFCCNTNAMSSIPSLSLNSLLKSLSFKWSKTTPKYSYSYYYAHIISPLCLLHIPELLRSTLNKEI